MRFENILQLNVILDFSVSSLIFSFSKNLAFVYFLQILINSVAFHEIVVLRKSLALGEVLRTPYTVNVITANLYYLSSVVVIAGCNAWFPFTIMQAAVI